MKTTDRLGNLSMPTNKFPITSIMTILYQVASGGLFLCLPMLIWLYRLSTISRYGFSEARFLVLQHPIGKWISLIILTVLFFYMLSQLMVLARLRNQEIERVHKSEQIILGTTILFLVSVGYWLW